MFISLDLWINDSTIQTAKDSIRISLEKAKEILGPVESIKVHGVKPK